MSSCRLPFCRIASLPHNHRQTFSGGWLLFYSYCSPLLMEMAASTHHSANSNPFVQQQQDDGGCLKWTAAKEQIWNTEHRRRRLPHEERQQRPTTNVQRILLARLPRMHSAIGGEGDNSCMLPAERGVPCTAMVLRGIWCRG